MMPILAGLLLVFAFVLLDRFLRKHGGSRVTMPAKGEEIVTFEGKVWRGKGGLYRDYLDPATGKPKPWPGGQWHEGREGRWWNPGILTQRVDKRSRWRWLWLRTRHELQEIKLFFLVLLRRKMK